MYSSLLKSARTMYEICNSTMKGMAGNGQNLWLAYIIIDTRGYTQKTSRLRIIHASVRIGLIS